MVKKLVLEGCYRGMVKRLALESLPPHVVSRGRNQGTVILNLPLKVVIKGLLLSCCLNCVVLATEPNDYIIPGKSYMCEGSLSGLRLAYQTFDAGLNDQNCPQCSTNRELKFLHAVTKTAMLFIDINDYSTNNSILELVQSFGVNVSGDYFGFFDSNSIDPNDLLDVGSPLDPNGRYKVPPDAPDVNGISNIVQDWISDINNIVAELNSISDSPSNRFRIFFKPNDTGLKNDLEVDYGEVLILKGLLLALKAQLEAKVAYDVFMNVNESLLHDLLYVNGIDVNDFNDPDCLELLRIINIDVDDPNQLSINQHLLGPYPDLLKVLPTANYPDVNGAVILAQAAQDFNDAISYYFSAIDYIQREADENDPQEDELLYIDPNNQFFLSVIKDRLTILQDSRRNDANMVYPFETAKEFNVYDANSKLIGQLTLVFDLTGIRGDSGSLTFTETSGIPSPWEVSNSFDVSDSSGFSVELESDTDGEWYEGYFEATFSEDGNSFSNGTFEFWGFSSGDINNLSGQLDQTEVWDVNINLNPIFGGTVTYPNPVNPRDLLPLFDKENIPIAGTFGHGLGNDPTLGGILPDMTQEDWAIPLPSDDFNDNLINTSMWSFYQESPNVWLDETNERLEIRSTADANGEVADYYANGWGFSTADNFSFRAYFHCSWPSAPEYSEFINILLGLVKGGVDPVTVRNNSVALIAGYYVDEYEIEPYFHCGKFKNDGTYVVEGQKTRSQDNGILYISYDASKDELYLSDTGYWSANAWVTIPGLLKGEWGSAVVIPGLGSGYVQNVALDSGEAYLDNFVVDSGTVGTVFTGKIIYVDADAPGLNNGSSWTDAYKYLQDGLTDARSSPKPVEIWVAQGTYRPDEDTLHPDGTGDRMAAFQLINGVAVYGGFPAGGGNWNQRNPNDPNNETILSGDIGTPLDKSDNCYHIFYHPDGLNLDVTAILDGFTITGGNTNGGDWPRDYCGGGMYNYNNSSPTVTNCTFSGNTAHFGGGMYNHTNSSPTLTNCNFSGNSVYHSGSGMYNYTNSSPTVKGCTFSGNSADYYGGGMFNFDNSSPTLTNCTFRGNSAAEWSGGGMYNGKCSPTLTNCTFSENSANYRGSGMYNGASSLTVKACTFSGNSAGVGGAIYCNNGSPFISNCIITRNRSLGEAGGLILYNCSLPVIDNCTISHNSPNVIWIYQTTADISGTVKVDSENIVGDGGSLWIEPGSTLETSDCRLSCSIVGTGTILVPAGREFVIENEAVVDLSGDGTLQCNGLLRVKDYGTLLYTNLNVARASFENNAVVAYNTITTSVSAPYGQLLAKDTASIIGNDIRAAGDRYIDIDPSTFGGMIQGNSISVTITEGTGNISAGLFELRGYDINCPSPPCPPGLFSLPEMPEFGLSTWTIDRMELVEGAKLTLTNRVDFQYPYDEGSEYEVLYVKQLILGPNSVLDTAFNRLYYETLEKDSTAKVKPAEGGFSTPLLGFSLGKIDFDDPELFATCIMHNNFIDYNLAPPDTTRIQVERVEGLPPDPTGMMWLRNLRDMDPASPTYGDIINARTKALFAKCTEEKILIRFKYLFNTAEPGTELVVYLSDVPELLDPNDPMRDYHYIEVGRIPVPPPGRPGSPGSGRFAVFQKIVSTEDLNFREGTRIEVELFEPQQVVPHQLFLIERASPQQQKVPTSDINWCGKPAPPPGASAFLDTWSAEVHCAGICLDLTGDNYVDEVDFMTVICACGCASGLLPGGTGSYVCFEGPFDTDGYIDSYDTSGWDWTLNSDNRKNLCDGIPLSEGPPKAGLIRGSLEVGNLNASGEIAPLGNPLGDFNDLLIAGKRGTTDRSTKLKDRLYVFDSNAQYVRSLSPATDRCNIKIAQDPNGQLYQINYEKGVRRLDTLNTIIIPRGQTTYSKEPRYNKSATVYVGIKGEGSNAVGRSILDAAFDANGYIYVVPVVVNPDGNEPYAAAAKLQLSSGSPPYTVVKLYDDPPLPGDNQYRNNLREIEIDSAGNLYVLNAHSLNESDVLFRYKPNGTIERIELAKPDVNLPDPIGMYMSDATDMLYLSSAQYNPQDSNSSIVYGFSTKPNLTLTRFITINNMHHTTSITEDPATGSLWVVGFNMDDIPQYPDPTKQPFYYPRFAKVPLDSNNIQAQSLAGSHDLAIPLSVVWTKTLKCGGADLNKSNKVDFVDFAVFGGHWRNSNCAPPAWCGGADINNSKTVELTDLAVLAEHWLQTGCQED